MRSPGPNLLRAVLTDFLDQIRSIEKVIELRDRLVEFGRGPAVRQNPTAARLHRVVRQMGLSGMQHNLDGSVLLTAAAFEQFVSDLMLVFTTDLPARIPSYSDLPRSIRSANERLTGEALDRSRARFADYELRRFIRNLNDCHMGVVPYVLNGEAIALNDRNLTPGTLRDLFSRLGINDIWTVVSATRTLQRWSGPGGAQTAGSRARNQLNELISNRNHIAHRVSHTTLGSQAIISYLRFIRALARSLVKVLEDYMASL